MDNGSLCTHCVCSCRTLCIMVCLVVLGFGLLGSIGGVHVCMEMGATTRACSAIIPSPDTRPSVLGMNGVHSPFNCLSLASCRGSNVQHIMVAECVESGATQHCAHSGAAFKGPLSQHGGSPGLAT